MAGAPQRLRPRQVDLRPRPTASSTNLDSYAGQLVGPLQQLAVASLGAIGNLLLIVVILSLYMVVDRDRILVVPVLAGPAGLARRGALLEASVARSFGGFLRGQVVMGVVYAADRRRRKPVLGLDFVAGHHRAAGLLMAIPFFGPFVAWVPPVARRRSCSSPEATLPALDLDGHGLVRRHEHPPAAAHGSTSCGIHPIVVLGSVLVGSKIAGIPGAIFGIPIAAVV